MTKEGDGRDCVSLVNMSLNIVSGISSPMYFSPGQCVREWCVPSLPTWGRVTLVRDKRWGLSRIHEHAFSLRFLGIIFRVLRLEVENKTMAIRPWKNPNFSGYGSVSKQFVGWWKCWDGHVWKYSIRVIINQTLHKIWDTNMTCPVHALVSLLTAYWEFRLFSGI